ncbi:MAG: tRNA (guanosine(46)-N7)-methyltransferase TrmB [Anaerolineales bacterium]|jgi:tRNA (guanine-N7-)-methyltransferase
MAKGRQVARVKLQPPKAEDEKKYLLSWGAKELYHNPENFPHIDRQSLFKEEGYLQLEIGCGTGEFICSLAKEFSNEKYIGIDFSRRAIYAAVNLAAANSLDNILFIKADIKQLYPLFTPKCLSLVYLHFPDPNYKSKHIKHRIFNRKFLDTMAEALTINGKISVVTDQKPFFMDMLILAETDYRFSKTHRERYLTDYTPKTKSRFQQAWERVTKSVYRFEIQKS